LASKRCKISPSHQCGIVRESHTFRVDRAGFLAKRNTKTGSIQANETGQTVPERVYSPLEDDFPAPHSPARPKNKAPETRFDDDFEQQELREGPAKEKPSMREVFGPGGFLEKCMIGGYEHRPAQLQMAEAVDDAFENHHHAILEAGTGTGKTLAYLLPAICSGRRVVVSTATKSLQEQLYQKDVPFLQKHFAPEWKVAVMKGRTNFLCLAKMHAMGDQPVLKGMDEVDLFRQIRDWAKLTETGDRAELTFLPDDSELWSRIDARRDTCTGKKCPHFDECFLTRMQARAKESDLIIVNHHLFFADLALKHDDFGSILPEYSAVVFDEAHEMEDVASDYFGQEISNFRFEELARDADQMMRLTHTAPPALLRRTQRIREKSRSFFDMFPPKEGRFPFSRQEREAFLEQNREAYDALLNALKGLETEFAALTQKPEELLRIARRSFEIRQELSFLFESNEKNYVYWFERRSKGVFLAATPIDVSQILRERLFEAFDTVILTSATLTVAGRFEFIRHRLGLDHAKESKLPPEFDYEHQALLYFPQRMPDVRDAGFASKAADEIVSLLNLSQGRAFCLFTSYAQMNDLFDRVSGHVDFPLLLQGTAPRTILLERFKTTPNAVLFATSTFWQGVDVPGEQLSCVIVDRLPFAVPSDPIVAARVRALQDEGRNAFSEFQVPEAVLALKQGFGRLIRTKTDRGVLVLLDTRISRMPYGKIFLESLPRYRRTNDLGEVERFLSGSRTT
jgi:ATP-dependent DNA helicase DinG